jgi:hypothetical protein
MERIEELDPAHVAVLLDALPALEALARVDEAR